MSRWTSCLILIALGMCNLSGTPSRIPRFEPPAGFVAARGTQLVRDGHPFRFVGMNCYELANQDERADAILGFLADHGVKVVRFWAFQSLCGPSGNDFRRFDRVLAAARKHDVLLLPVLENHWKHWTYHQHGERWKPVTWYAGGWRTEHDGKAPLTFRDYLRALGSHYRNEPQILAWQLVNEPEIDPETSSHARILQAFACEAAHELRAVDPHHLISLGLLGVGQPSTSHCYFARLHACPDINLVTAHDHGYWDDPLPGQGWTWPFNTVYADLTDAAHLGKPFLITEAGIPQEWVKSDFHLRAQKFRAKLQAFSQTATAGYMLWNYEPIPSTDFAIGPDDPVWAVLKEAEAWFDVPQ